MRFSIVDVFAEQSYQGNQLAVVRDAGGLDAATMQAVAREMNFSETTFVVAEGDDHATVRIFTPGEELPFAGHPTLGTAWVLAAGRTEQTLRLGVGPIRVTFADGIAWFTPPLAEFGATLAPDVAAALTGLEARDLDLSLPPRLVRCGPWFPIVAVRDLDTLRRIRVDRATQARLAMPDYAFVVCRGGYGHDADFAARMIFFDGTTLREDPATGSANAAFAQYLQRLGERGRRIVEQGFEMRRPSRIHLELRDSGASPDIAPVTVGGQVQPVAEGELR